ncbi:MAG: GNAT family N-acetyltransferase [Dysgonamonadaceae bacterium]|jgi:ribosomal protein S18 acetylase RimI-like enzyme|nr:GNAT family N-acetyltransferase [Dysgonamonadaceae bacterium]
MIEIIPASEQNIPDIRQISASAWPDAFREILSPQQIEYMMEMMYSDAALREQMNVKNHRFVLAKDADEYVGYMSYELHYKKSGKTKIHKIYLLPDRKKKGIGRQLVEYASQKAQENDDTAIFLNVNKYNRKAIDFYYRTGFQLVKDEVIPIGDGFVMDDFVFEKKINRRTDE